MTKRLEGVTLMAFFGRKRESGLSSMDVARYKQRISQLPPSALAPPYLLPQKEEFIAAIWQVNLDRVLSIYQAADPDRRYRYMEEFGPALFAETVDSPALVSTWLTRLAQPANPQQMIVAGAIYQAVGWQVRGADFADRTPNEDLRTFADYLRYALPLLLTAGQQLGNTDIVPFLLAQDCCYAVSLEEARHVSHYWRALEPWNKHGIRRLAFLTDERWSGQAHAWIQLAQEIVDGAPVGSGSLPVVAELVLERWDYLTVFADYTRDEADAETVEAAYVQQLVVAAYQKLFGGINELDSTEQARALNYFAWVFYWADLLDLAHQTVMQIQGRVNQYAWELRSDEGGVAVSKFDHARNYLIGQVELGFVDFNPAEWQ